MKHHDKPELAKPEAAKPLSVPPPAPNPFTEESLSKSVKVQPAEFAVAHKTTGDLMAEFPHSPPSLAKSMADFLNGESAAGKTCIGAFGDTTNHYFIFR